MMLANNVSLFTFLQEKTGRIQQIFKDYRHCCRIDCFCIFVFKHKTKLL